MSTKAHLAEHNCAMGRKQLAELQADLEMVKKERDKALAAEKELFDRHGISPTGRAEYRQRALRHSSGRGPSGCGPLCTRWKP